MRQLYSCPTYMCWWIGLIVLRYEYYLLFRSGVLNSIYLEAARGRVWVRLGRIRARGSHPGVSLADRQVGWLAGCSSGWRMQEVLSWERAGERGKAFLKFLTAEDVWALWGARQGEGHKLSSGGLQMAPGLHV